VVGTDGFGLVVFGVCCAVDTFVFLWGSCTISQYVPPCTEGACVLSSAVTKPVVSGAFKTSVYGYIDLHFAY